MSELSRSIDLCLGCRDRNRVATVWLGFVRSSRYCGLSRWAHRPSFGHAWRGSRRRLDLGSVGDQLGAPSNAPGAGDPPAHETLPFFSGVAFTPDGAIALAACDRYTVPAKLRPRDRPELPAWWHRGVRAFRLSDGQELDLVPLYTPIREIFVSRDGTKLMVYGARFGIWDLTNGSLVWDKGNGYEIGIAASADCRLIARGTGYQVDDHSPYINTAVELYDGTNGEFLSWGAHGVPPTAIAFTSERSLAAGGGGGELRIWQWSPDPLI